MIQQVLSQYDLGHAALVEPLGNAGGFSGCQLWQIRTVVGEFCLRKWTQPKPSFGRLQMIHNVLQHTYRSGCDFVAVPLKTKTGETLFRFDNDHWEVTEWMPGKADFSGDPNDVRLASAVHAIARFHVAASTIDRFTLPNTGSENLRNVLDNLQHVELTIANVAKQKHEIQSPLLLLLLRNAQQHILPIAKQLQNRIQPFLDTVFTNQPVIRDVWHDHVFFVGNKVSGLVDFGALSIDIVSFDLARLLGSLVGDQPQRIQWALDVYQQTRELSEAERELVPLLDSCGVVIGAVNWLKWLVVEKRQFESEEAVEKRISTLSSRLGNMAIEFS